MYIVYTHTYKSMNYAVKPKSKWSHCMYVMYMYNIMHSTYTGRSKTPCLNRTL